MATSPMAENLINLNLDEKRSEPAVTGSLIPSIGNGTFGFTLYATF